MSSSCSLVHATQIMLSIDIPAGPLGPVVRYDDNKIDDTGIVMRKSGSVRFSRKYCERRTGPCVRFSHLAER